MTEPRVPADVAREANRAIFYRYLSILAVLGLAAIGWIGLHNVQRSQDPCSTNLHSLECQARTCVRLNDVHAKLTPYCELLLDKVRKGQQPLGPGSGSASGASAGRHDLGQLNGSSGGGASTKPPGSSQPGPGSGPATSAPGDNLLPSVTTPDLPLLGRPGLCLAPVVGVNC